MLLNGLNGTIDLTTGALRPHDRRDMITRVISIECDPTAVCPTFEKVFKKILRKKKLIKFLQRAFDYSLSESDIVSLTETEMYYPRPKTWSHLPGGIGTFLEVHETWMFLLKFGYLDISGKFFPIGLSENRLGLYMPLSMVT